MSLFRDSALLKRDFKLPRLSWGDAGRLCLLLFVPNLLFLLPAYFSGTARPLLNADYLLPVLLLAAPWRPVRLSGLLLLWMAVVFDALMLAVQIFPFLDLAAVRYLLPFVFEGPPRYIVLIALLLLFLVLLSWLMWREAGKVGRFWLVGSLSLAAVFAGLGQYVRYHDFPGGMLGRDNYFVAHSQWHLYREMTGDSFAKWLDTTPVLHPYPAGKDRAARRLKTPAADKVLYIVAESWGMARKPEVQQSVLRAIYARQQNLAWIDSGHFDFGGSTVQAEFRELCGFSVANGYAFTRTPSEAFASCMPNRFLRQGYHTAALHGTSGRLYERVDWYRKAGFRELLFGEHFLKLPRCTAFNGVCDSALVDEVGKVFAANRNRRLFFYWLTLTSHAPYARQDIRSPERLPCRRYGMQEDGDICRNMQLSAQFFDDLGELIERPEMAGTEVVVVGDHMPPLLFSSEPIHPNLYWQEVPWLHFQIKARSVEAGVGGQNEISVQSVK